MDASTNPDVVAEVAVPVEETFIADPSKHAFVTWVIHGDAYVTGALVLGYSIRKHNSKAALVCLVSSDVSEQAKKELKTIFDDVKVVSVINVKVPLKRRNDTDLDAKLPFIGQLFTKLHALNLVQYEKIALLDADQLCLSFPDNIFNCTIPAGICPSLIKQDGSFDNQLITSKNLDAAVKKNGIRGCTYLLKPSVADFERAIKLLTVKPKVVQYKVAKDDSISLFTASKSVFSLLDEDEQSEEEEVVQKKVTEKTVITLTPEDIALLKADNGNVEPETFTYDVYTNENAPLGFAYGEGRKGLMTYDEMLFVDLYKGQWKHLSDKYGHISWKKSDIAPVFCHFTSEHPWTRVQEWPDFEVWDAIALDLIKTDSHIRERLLANVINLDKKEEAGNPAPINPPAPKVKTIKKKEEAVVATPAAAVAAPAAVVKPVDEEEVKPVFVPVAAVESVWGKKK